MKIDKLTEIYTLRIPEILKKNIDRLPKSNINKMNKNLRILMARECHEASFDPEKYLSTEE